MKYVGILGFFVAMVLVASIAYAAGSSADSVTHETDPPLLCKPIALPTDALWQKCQDAGMVVVQIVENGCVVGYDCGPAYSSTDAAPVCSDLAPPSDELCSKCHDAGMLVEKITSDNGCVSGYECAGNPLMRPITSDECIESVPCSVVDPTPDQIAECKDAQGTLTVRYDDQCNAEFECNFIGPAPGPEPSPGPEPAPGPEPLPMVNQTTGCPVVDVPAYLSTACKNLNGVIVVRYTANCEAKFNCLNTANRQPNTNQTGNGTGTGNGGNSSGGGAPEPVPSLTSNCQVDPALITEFNTLVKQLREQMAGSAADSATVARMKQRLAELTIRIRQQKDECAQRNVTPPTIGTAVGINCEVPEDLQKNLLDAWNQYRALLGNTAEESELTMEQARTRIISATAKINAYKKQCQAEIVPGLTTSSCDIPDTLMQQLEQLYTQYENMQRSMNPSQQELENIKSRITQLETQLRVLRAKCNKLTVDNTTTVADVANYYAQKMSDASTESADAQLTRLEDIKTEIDETIKDMIAQRKKVAFKDIAPMVDEVTVAGGSVDVGDSTADTTDVQIDTQVDGSTVSVSNTDSNAIITQDGLSVETPEVSISDGNLSVNGTHVVPPKDLLAVKVLERNKERIQQLTLERRNAALTYYAQVQAKKRILGIIPATAEQTVTVDAQTGDVVSQEKPWWTSISTDAK